MPHVAKGVDPPLGGIVAPVMCYTVAVPGGLVVEAAVVLDGLVAEVAAVSGCAGNNSGIFKNLDIIMGSEEFIKKFDHAHDVVMFQIDGNKASGPYGCSLLLFKKAWNIVGKDICKSIMEFFDSGKMLKEINSTLISLIPKIQTPSKIIKCVSTTTFSICVNEESCGYFKRGRGLIQGDPMSPYLFTLIMEILNLIFQDKVECSEDFQYHFGCKRMKMTHRCFADDVTMFCHGNCKSVSVLKDTIDEFGAVLGLLPNYSKITIIFGSMKDLEKDNILEGVPFKVEKLPVNY
nr:RNA-directed DNA polymerase, eukaryota, reverse transcriptase zinc-binding domain protein [Tanacetum cinerariifolium]